VVDLVKDAAMVYFICNGILYIGQNVYWNCIFRHVRKIAKSEY